MLPYGGIPFVVCGIKNGFCLHITGLQASLPRTPTWVGRYQAGSEGAPGGNPERKRINIGNQDWM